jgi:hypothetical protein
LAALVALAALMVAAAVAAAQASEAEGFALSIIGRHTAFLDE